jgi:hypothetical protein
VRDEDETPVTTVHVSLTGLAMGILSTAVGAGLSMLVFGFSGWRFAFALATGLALSLWLCSERVR